MIKENIVKALKWALSKFEEKPVIEAAWPFPAPAKKQVKKPNIVKKRIALKKATTRPVKKTIKKAK
jgi:hypothetical protein